MQTLLNTADTKEPVDYDNLNIITQPRPPRRRQSGVSLIPFRPYVKCLTSVRQPFSFANGYDRWMVMGRDEIFFKQPNARCIGTLIEDCDISDVIRWDIEPESTRLPMMCKLWMIVDGAVVERGKPHLVQDTAIQVFTSGRSLTGLLTTQQHFNSKPIKNISDRYRRQSWQDINEYHSVPYYQYTRAVQKGSSQGIQCNIDDEKLTSVQEVSSNVEEDIIDKYAVPDFKKGTSRETVQNSFIPKHHLHISITIQTKPRYVDQSTSIDSQFIEMFHLNLEKNEILLSSVANPYHRALPSNFSSEIISIYRNNIEYNHRGMSTGDDYPHEWLRLTTDFILSNFIKIQRMEKEKSESSPSPRHNQRAQTDVNESKIFLSKSTCFQNSSSSVVTTNHYEVIDEINDENNTKQFSASPNINRRNYSDDDTISHLNNNNIEKSSTRNYSNINKQSISYRQSDNSYNSSVSSLNPHQQQSYSTSYPESHLLGCCNFSNDTVKTRTKSSESTSTLLLTNLLERYERSLRERQKAITIVNNELLDIDDVVKYYRQKLSSSSLKQSNAAMEHYRDISLLSAESKQEQPSPIITNLIKDKYRSMPGLTSEDMIKAYMPIPKVHIKNSSETLSRKRQTRFDVSSTTLIRPDYCDLCLTGCDTSSAWIRYNERRIEELQKRIDLMLQIDDDEESQLLLSSSSIIPTIATVTQRIDDILWDRSRNRNISVSNYQTLSPRQYRRLHQSLPISLRLLNRYTSHSPTPLRKSVRISTETVPSYRSTYQRPRSPSRPIRSILRSRSVPPVVRFDKPVESPYFPTPEIRGNIDDLQQYSIPRYYRLYDDVSFRQMYNFSRMLDGNLASDRISRKTYSSLIKDFALDQQIPSPITSVA